MSHAKNTKFVQNVGLLVTALVLSACTLGIFHNHYHARAASEPAKWITVNIPAEGDTGNWVLAPGSDITYLTAATDGMLYAGLDGPTYSLLRSGDGGCSWEHTSNVQDAIVGIAVSPHDASTVYYATPSNIYRSTNHGQTFSPLPPNPGNAGNDNIEITSIDATYLNGNTIAVGTRDNDAEEYGGVYILNESEAIPVWVDTGIGGYDILNIAFSPDYNSGVRMAAVGTDEHVTYVFLKNGYNDWNADTGLARIDTLAEDASIAFPASRDGSVAPDDLACYIGIATGGGSGDVYKIDGLPAPANSIASDLDVGQIYGQSGLDITGLAVYDDGHAVTLIAGAADSALTYTSIDNGASWTRCHKAPTGESRTGLLLAPDFDTSGKMYAFTGGFNSAFSASNDTGTTWNQLGLVDCRIDTIVDVAPSPQYDHDTTIFMLTFGGSPYSQGLWRTQDGGYHWERTLAGMPDAVDVLNRVAVAPEYGEDCRTVFLAGESHGNPAIWESTDNGQSFRHRLSRDPANGVALNIDAWCIINKTTILVGSYDGSQAKVYRSTNSGAAFTEGRSAGNQPLHALALSPDYTRDGTILAGNTNGQVFRADGNTDFQPLNAAVPYTGQITLAFDTDFSRNQVIYAAAAGAGDGVYRYVIGQSTAWENIDATLPAGATLNDIRVLTDGTLYTVNSRAGGGLERCLKPAASGSVFNTVTHGLSSDATLYGLWQAGHRLWSVDTSHNKLMTYDDTLTSPPVLLSPEPDAIATGNLSDHTVRNVSLDWETLDGASGYEWECAYDADFLDASGVFGDITSGSSVRLPALEPATTYHWRVRAGGPTLSPWSEKRAFTTIMDTEALALKTESPAAGASEVPVKPVFQWTALVGAEGYELIVATDAEGNNPVILRAEESALRANVWQCDVNLEYATTYYWKVRATTASTRSPWSAASVFTTVATPSDSAPPEGTVAGATPSLDKISLTPLPPKSAPAPTEAPPITAAAKYPDISQLPDVPDWLVYLIGGLLLTIILALSVILVIVLKIKRVA